jgi:16S rRNA (guanine527-N7)-methyltransferase
VLATPGLTAIRDPSEARRFLLEDALRALPHAAAAAGPIVDVGSGGGSPGIPIAAMLPERRTTLLDASRRKCRFLETWTRDLPNIEVVWGRAEEQETERFGVALAKALAKPSVAAELTLPLVQVGGIALIWTGATADRTAVNRAASALAAELEADDAGLLVLRKTGATPPGFPRRSGMAKKRPLA